MDKNDCARIERKCQVDWLFDLLHAGEYWRRGRSLCGIVGAQASWGRKRISRFRVERAADVLRGAPVF